MARRRAARLDQPRVVRRGLPRPHYDPEAFGRFSETIARFIGTARFLVIQTVIVIVWIGYNGWLALECRLRGDPEQALPAVTQFLRRYL